MEIIEFKNRVFKRADEKGLKEYEIFYSRSDNFGVTVYKGEIDKYSLSCTMGVGFRALINGKMGYAYTEKLDEDGVEFLIHGVIDSAHNIDNEEKQFIYNEVSDYIKIHKLKEEEASSYTEEKIKLALNLEEQVMASGNKVVNIGYCGLGCSTEERGIFNSYGINVSDRSSFVYAAVTPVVSDEGKLYNETSYIMANSIKDIDAAKLAAEAVSEAESRIGGDTVESGKYKVVLRNDVAAELLKTFSGAFCADNVQKGLSLLKGKEGSIIASEKITLVDNPLLKDAAASTSFDGEGVPTYEKAVIEQGALKLFLHNLKTAAIDGVKSTGNASRASYSSPIGISPTNFYFTSGKQSLEQMIQYVGEGIMITDIAGTHAGANAITGDFSLAAKGFVISAGKLGRPVEQITIAANYYDVLNNVLEVGSDLKFILPSSLGCFGSPSMVIGEMSIAGK